MYKSVKNRYILTVFIIFSIFIISSISIAKTQKVDIQKNGIIKIVESENYKKSIIENVKTINESSDIEHEKHKDVDTNNVANSVNGIGFVEKAANMLFANTMIIANQVGGKITTIIGVIVLSMFVLDISKMVLQSQLSQVSIGATLSQYLNKILTLGFVSALLLIPLPNNMRYNGITNFFQWIINKMLSMWLHIGQLFFPDDVYNRLVNTSDLVVQTATIPFTYKAGDVIPGRIASEIVELPLKVIQSGIWKMLSLWSFFSGVVLCIVGIYMLFKIIGIVSIFISAVFEFIVLLTLSSIYMPFLLLESTKDRIGNKPLELLLTQGIKLVVTTGLMGMLVTLLTTGALNVDTAGFITVFMVAVAFSIMEKIINNNNQIATTILQGGGLGVSTGNEFFAMASQVGMMAGGAAIILGNGAVGNIKDFKTSMNEGNGVLKSLKDVGRNTMAGKTISKGGDIANGVKGFFKDIKDGKNVGQSLKKHIADIKAQGHKRDSEYYKVKSNHSDTLENIGIGLQVFSVLSGDQQLMMLSNLLTNSFNQKAYMDSYRSSEMAAEASESIKQHHSGNNSNFEYESNNNKGFTDNFTNNNDTRNDTSNNSNDFRYESSHNTNDTRYENINNDTRYENINSRNKSDTINKDEIEV